MEPPAELADGSQPDVKSQRFADQGVDVTVSNSEGYLCKVRMKFIIDMPPAEVCATFSCPVLGCCSPVHGDGGRRDASKAASCAPSQAAQAMIHSYGSHSQGSASTGGCRRAFIYPDHVKDRSQSHRGSRSGPRAADPPRHQSRSLVAVARIITPPQSPKCTRWARVMQLHTSGAGP